MKLLLSQIQTILINTAKYYKQNLPYYKKRINQFTEGQLKLLEEKCGANLTEDEIDFINWVNFNPIDGIPFINFTDDGRDFKCWGRNIYYIINRLNEYKDLKIQLFEGWFNLRDTGEELLFNVILDVTGQVTGKKGSVYIDYGEIKENYHGEFKDEANNKRIIIAEDIKSFTETYLKYLKTIPYKPYFSKKIDALLNDPIKLFKFIKKYNFDDGEEKIEQIIKDSRCDKASALLIYWFSQPYFYTDATLKELNLIPYIIESNFAKNLYKESENKFDPAQNDIADFIQEYNQANNKNRVIPEFMLKMVI